MSSNSIKIRKHLVNQSLASRVTYGGVNPIKYIVWHETANTSRGANANAHARLQANGNSRRASWHYQVDDKEIVQSFADTAQCWHAGSRAYNEQSIGVEICVNSDGDFRKAVENAAKLGRFLMAKYNIPIDRNIQHNQASGKDCPRYLRSGEKGVDWAEFRRMLSGKSAKPSKAAPKKSKSKTKSISQMAAEVIAEKHGNGHDNRRKSLGVSAAVYEKVRAEVNRRAGKTKATAKKPSKPRANLRVDGYLGRLTIRALQRYFNTPVDGVISKPSTVIRALQRFLGVKADGYLGPVTIRAMQRRFGTVVDGKISKPSLVIKELQRRLNRGKL